MPGDDLLALIDEGGRVVEWGCLAEELFGWSAEEAAGQMVTALLREAAAGGAWWQEGFSEAAAVLVKPVRRGSSVVWQVRTAGRDAAGPKVSWAQSLVGLLVLDGRLQVVRVDAASQGLRGAPVGHLLGRHFIEAYALEDPGEEAAVAGGVLESGEPVANRLVRGGETAGRPGCRIYSVSYFRLEDFDGEVLGLVASAADVTERERAHDRLALMDTVRAHVGQQLNIGVVCRELAQAVVPAFAGITVVEVIEDVVRGEDPPRAPVEGDVPLRRAAFEGLVSAYPVGDVRPLPAGTPFSRVLCDLRPRLVPIGQDSAWLAADPARADAIRQSAAHSLLVAPLALRGRVLGVVSFYRHGQEDPFDEDDIEVASAVCAHAALCIDNARRYMREWIIASTVQRRILPRPPLAQSAVEISHLHLPGPQGCDAWCDAIALPGARTALAVGDVTGRGIVAAITLGLLRTAIHTLAALDLQPDELLARLSDTVARLAAERAALPAQDPLHHEPLTARCTIALYDPVDLTCTVACAGLPEPVAVLPDGTRADLSVPQGPPLAAAGRAPFPATTVGLPEGSTLVMGTAAPINGPAPPGAQPLLPDQAGTMPLADLRDHIACTLAGGEGRNGTLVLLARTKALPEDRVLTRPLPADPEAAPIARRAARRRLEDWGLDEETAFTAELIISELVGNAVRYGAPPLQLRLILDRMLTCEVSDAAASAPHVKHARTIDETGRGLFIVASLADQWGTRFQALGKTVWAQQPTGAPRQAPHPQEARPGIAEPRR
ncbi:SpoIIE family protein phosphatase [Streptomyces sp. NPDC050564]|uniref:SpoIIE family protein phosphatase n=1 Tax=Streptomyces sp. NPDC050564 TaxID=3365631 RepID=UPI0037899CAE